MRKGIRMNILFVYSRILHPERGGVERVTDLLAKELARRGHRIFYLHNPGDEEAMKYSFPVTQMAFFPNPTHNITDENGLFYRNYVERENIDIVINQDFTNYSELCRFSKGIKRVRSICVQHNNPLYEYNRIFDDTMFWWNQTLWQKIKGVARIFKVPYRKYKYRKRLIQKYEKCLECTDVICLLSPLFIPSFRKIVPIDFQKIVAIHNPNTYPCSLTIHPKKKQLLYVGRIEWRQKRLERLIGIWKRIYMKFPDWELLLVGDGGFRPELEQECRRLERVRFMGYQDPKPFYQETSILCLTSDSEGWGLVIPEAMTFGTIPVIFNSYATAKDLIENGENGILVPPFSLRRFARELSALMKDETKRAKMAQACVQSVGKYDIQRIGDEWEKLFQKLKNDRN